ncbi:hypothetical protein AB0M02_02040 [Actinoplanes sp. NPDC051861]|uniref:hypothetical protein n=1 Tax=Actinoplanes sp. NPDC051861 TaxID=3155170 RepID=UPI00342AD0E4
MTNWMTAAGLAFIAGGLATLISFRAVIFGGGGRRVSRAGAPARRRRPVAVPPAPPVSRPIREPEGDVFPSTEFDCVEPLPEPLLESLPEPETRAGRRRRLAAAFSGRPSDPDADGSGLASIGLADDAHEDEQGWPEQDESEQGEPEDGEDGPRMIGYEDHEPEEPERDPERDDPDYDDDRGYDDYEWAAAQRRPAADPWAGDRVENWVRPHYRDLDDRPPAGDYWTPVPDDLYADPEPSARGYGWPIPVERLPPVPDYEPATGFDLTPVQAAEPTTLVPAWHSEKHPAWRPERPGDEESRRIRLPRSWAARDEKATAPRHGRPRPRPRPTERSEPGTGYVSRHSAGAAD